MSAFENILLLEDYCNMTENVAKQGLQEQKKSVDFLNELKE
jgi:hypothetical protein